MSNLTRVTITTGRQTYGVNDRLDFLTGALIQIMEMCRWAGEKRADGHVIIERDRGARMTSNHFCTCYADFDFVDRSLAMQFRLTFPR